MKRTSLLLALLGCVALFLAPAPSGATTITQCLAEMALLTQQTDAAVYLQGEHGRKVQARLLRRMEQAARRLDEADRGNAIKEMDGYSTELSKGVGAGRIDSADAARLQEGANGVVACISAVGA